MRIKRVLSINDLSGIGRCSLTVILPVVSAMGFQVVPLPTALFSAHTGYSNIYSADLTAFMRAAFEKHCENGERFDAVATGFIANAEQGDIILDIFAKCGDIYKLVDPVMGDGGVLYPTYTAQMCEKIKRMCAHADIVTPNITEACILAGEEYRGESPDENTVRKLCRGICALGAKAVAITGVCDGDKICTYYYHKEDFLRFATPRVQCEYPGTGDLFVSVLLGAIMRGADEKTACRLAAEFVCEGIKLSFDGGFPTLEGIVFEPLLKKLMTNLK